MTRNIRCYVKVRHGKVYQAIMVRDGERIRLHVDTDDMSFGSGYDGFAEAWEAMNYHFGEGWRKAHLTGFNAMLYGNVRRRTACW